MRNTRSFAGAGRESQPIESAPSEPGTQPSGARSAASRTFAPDGSPSSSKESCVAGRVPKLRTTTSTANGRPARGIASQGYANTMVGSGAMSGFRSTKDIPSAPLDTSTSYSLSVLDDEGEPLQLQFYVPLKSAGRVFLQFEEYGTGEGRVELLEQ